MIWEVRIAGANRKVEVEQARDGRLHLVLDGTPVEAEFTEISDDTFSILLRNRCFEVHVESHSGDLLIRCCGEEFLAQVNDPRGWRRTGGAWVEAAGPQSVTTPMPGKIVRLLVSAGEKVQAGQGLIVVEAMKMQNEIRSPKSGIIERVFVTENQAVAAGEQLLVIA